MAQYGFKNTTGSPVSVGTQTIPALSTMVFHDSATHFSDYQDDIDTALNSDGTLNSMLASDAVQFLMDGVAQTDQKFYDFWGSYYGYKVVRVSAEATTDSTMVTPQAASMFWASPVGSAKGSPTFRRIDASDIPDLSASYAKVTGQTFTGRVVMSASTALASGFNLSPGVTPGSPANGDLWSTNSGLFVQINGTTIQLNSTQTFLAVTGGTMTGKLVLAQPTASSAPLNMPVGVAPTTPAAGDLYSIAGYSLKYYNGSTAKTLVFVDNANVWLGKQSFVASSAAGASINVPTGSAPTTPVSGDVWNLSGALTWYNGSASLTVAATNAINTWSATQNFNYLVTCNGGLTLAGSKLALSAAGSSYPSLNMPSSAAPSITVAGDIWNQSGLIKFHNGSSIVTLASLEASSSWTGIQTFASGASISNARLNTAAATATYASLNVASSAVDPSSPVSGDLWNKQGSLTWHDGSAESPVALTAVTQTWSAAPVFGAGLSVENGVATFAQSSSAFASLNVPNSSVSPTAHVVGDIWTLNNSLMFHDGSDQTLASLEKNQTFTGSQTFSAAIAATAGLVVTNAKTTLAVSTNSTSSLNIPSSSVVVTSPSIGDISVYRSSLKFHDGQADREIVKNLWAQTTTVTIANTTTLGTLVGTIVPTLGNTLPANFFSYVGKRMRVTCRGTVYDAGATTMQFQLLFGTAVVLTTGAITIPKLNSNPESWTFEADLVCRSTGASGTIQCNGICLISNNTTGLSTWHLKVPSTLATVNTTISTTVGFTAKWGAANANNTVSMTQFMGQG